MFTKTTRFAVAAVAVTLFAQPFGVSADTRSLSEIDICMQALKDTKDARAANPVIGAKATVDFDKLVAEAEAKCQAGQSVDAQKMLVEARGMVASE